jgi:hypothetical protein
MIATRRTSATARYGSDRLVDDIAALYHSLMGR